METDWWSPTRPGGGTESSTRPTHGRSPTRRGTASAIWRDSGPPRLPAVTISGGRQRVGPLTSRGVAPGTSRAPATASANLDQAPEWRTSIGRLSGPYHQELETRTRWVATNSCDESGKPG